MYELIDGKKISDDIKLEIKNEIAELKEKFGKVPGLAVILVGENPASKVYVNSKEKSCIDLGIHSEKYVLSESVSQEELLDLIEKLNKDENIHGILVQLPLPKHIDSQKVLNLIAPDKDVDGFHPVSVGRLVTGDTNTFYACTPYGVIELLKRSNVEIAGKDAVVIGRSNIVGKPVSVMLLNENATVTMTHSKTQNLAEVVRRADIVVAAIGKPKFVTADMIKEGAVVIDVGINRVNEKLVGDVDFDNVKNKCSKITPVPKGVGPMTIAMLMKNTLESFKRKNKI